MQHNDITTFTQVQVHLYPNISSILTLFLFLKNHSHNDNVSFQIHTHIYLRNFEQVNTCCHKSLVVRKKIK